MDLTFLELDMSTDRVDLNLLVYLDALLKARIVTKAAHQLGLSQPAMSNGLRRLREVFEDPLLIRTSYGMTPTERALGLQSTIRAVLATIDKAVQPRPHLMPSLLLAFSALWPVTIQNLPSFHPW